MKPVGPLLALAFFPALALAQQQDTAKTAVPDILALGDSVAGSGSELARTRRLVHWINDWIDHQKFADSEFLGEIICPKPTE